MARRFSTLDHLTEGRVAWNVVTSYLESAARNFGLYTQVEHDKRYDMAQEYMEVVYKVSGLTLDLRSQLTACHSFGSQAGETMRS